MRARLRGADGKDGEPMRYLPHQIYLMRCEAASRYTAGRCPRRRKPSPDCGG